MAQSILKTGEIIEGALVRSQAFKQARQLGEAISQTNPQSDDWPQQAAFLVAQYPLAAQSGLAKQVMEPVGKAYAGYQAAKVAAIRQKQAGTLSPVYVPPGSGGTSGTGGATLPDLANPNSDPLNVSMGQRGIPGVLADTFHVMAGGDSQPADIGGDILPPLPDAASAMSRRKKPLQDYVDQFSTTYNDALAAKKQPPFTRSQIAANAARQKAADDREIEAQAKANATPVDLHPSALVPGVMLTPKGTPFNQENGTLVHPASQFAQERIDMSKAAAETRAARAEKTDVVKAANAEYTDAQRDFTTQDRLLHDLEKQAGKITDPDARAAHQAVTVEQQKRAQAAKDRQAKALAAYKDVLKTSGKVRVIKPDGTPGIIPKSQLEQALKEGYREQ